MELRTDWQNPERKACIPAATPDVEQQPKEVEEEPKVSERAQEESPKDSAAVHIKNQAEDELDIAEVDEHKDTEHSSPANKRDDSVDSFQHEEDDIDYEDE